MDALYQEEPRSLPVGTVTFLLTDIEGSTKRWEKHPRLMQDVVRRHDEILIHIVEENGGVDLRKKGEGDSHFAVFASATNAVEAAMQMHQFLMAEDWGEVGPIKIRIAIHTGEAEIRNDDYYGQAVNRCARLRGVAHGGQTILSDSTKRLAGQLPDEISLKDLGQHRLKDLLEPERIYQLNAPGLESEFAPLSSLSAAKHNLPVQLSTFIGRVEQLEKIKALVYNNRLVTLLGAGGSGKTRLALQVAADVLDEFPDGVWFTSLVDIQDPASLPQAVAESLPISVQGKDPLEAIIENYSEARPLLIIDNCEHVVDSAAKAINTLLRKCPKMVVLATSRESLGVSGESTFNVPTMACDLLGKRADIATVAGLEAAQLFTARAASRLSGEDILTPETAKDIAALCKKVDGIPLAIEQAAASLSYMSVSQVLDRLEKHFSMLALDEVGVEDRHKTIQATIDWSYGMLTEPERHLFANLSVFSGGWSIASCEQVCADEILSASQIAPTLQKLIKRSLVLAERYEGLNEARFRMLEPIRQYAESRRIASSERALRERHFEFCCNLAEHAAQAGLDSDGGRYLGKLIADQDNVRSALAWCMNEEFRPERAVELCLSMFKFWLRQDYYREGASWLQRAMNLSPTLPVALRAEALLDLGILVWQQGNLDAAEKSLTASYDLYCEAGDQNGCARAQGNLANLAATRNDFLRAASEYAGVAEKFRKLGDLERLCSTLENLGVVESNLGCLESACASLEEAVIIHRRLGHTAALAKAIDSMLGVYGFQGTLLDHLDLFKEATKYALEANVEFLTESLLEAGAQICICAGEFLLAAQALGAIQQSVEAGKRLVQPSLQALRDKLVLRVQGALEPKAFRQGMRHGRALGCREVLKSICDCLTLSSSYE